VIIHLSDRVIKGYIDRGSWPAKDGETTGKRMLRIRTLDGSSQLVSIEETRAVFFVRSFHATAQEPLRFHDNAPPPDCLWVRLTFPDGEVIEGMVQNGRRFLLDPGFLLTPTDPTGNNWLIYVLKSNVLNFQILGLRHRSSGRKFVSLTPISAEAPHAES
jgi:hypothetical protein